VQRRAVRIVVLLAIGAIVAFSITASAVSPEDFLWLLEHEGNLVANPAFREGLVSWNTFGPSGPFIWGLVDEGPFGKAMQVEGALSYDLVYQDVFGLEPGVEYVAYGWVKTDISAEGAFARVTVASYNASQDVIQYEFSKDQRIEEGDPVGQRGQVDWQLHRVTFTQPEGTVYITIQGTSMGEWDFEDSAMWTGFVVLRRDAISDEDYERFDTVYSN